LRGAVGALPSEQSRLIEQLFWQERTETEVAAGDGYQPIHHQSPQARYSEGSPMKLRDRNEFQKFPA